MKRRNFIQKSALTGLLGTSLPAFAQHSIVSENDKNENDREYWINLLSKIAEPLLKNLAAGELKKNMPVECQPGQESSRRQVTYLEGFGRLLNGMAPWLNLGADDTPEGKIRGKFINWALQSLDQATDPNSPDVMNFTEHNQPLVDAAFLAHALILAEDVLWKKLSPKTQANLVKAFQSSRVTRPYNSNWILFSAMVEAALLKLTGEADLVRIDLAIRQTEEWYKGDGMFGDGEEFHWDYYNSYVIQPFLVTISRVVNQHEGGKGSYAHYEQKFLKIAQRHAAIQERLIQPDGKFPPIGRSLAYRVGAFQLLAQIAYLEKLPEPISPAQIRCALTAAMKATLEPTGTFNAEGWLNIGFCGHQLAIGETYISTGSLYLCSMAFLPLGLPTNNPFWSAPATDWTSKRIWQGENIPVDKAMKL